MFFTWVNEVPELSRHSLYGTGGQGPQNLGGKTTATVNQISREFNVEILKVKIFSLTGMFFEAQI